MNKKIAILGAFDRFNYGDLLFPIIIEKVFMSYNVDYQIEYYGLIDSNLSKFDGKPTSSIKKLFSDGNLPNGSVLIVGGGEILGATWYMMHRHLSSHKSQRIFVFVRFLVGNKNADSISRFILGSKTKLPWVISPSDFSSSIFVIYNTVGGSRLLSHNKEYQKYIEKQLNEASYLSVRDNSTKNLLDNLNLDIDVKLAPDSAILMSEFFPVSYLENKMSLETSSIINHFSKGYICFQTNYTLAKGNEYEIANQLTKICKSHDYGLVLLPIGRAPGHDDHIILKEINKLLEIDSIVPQENGIYDIMALIAKSKLFAGTSLHGCITALSFCIPHIGLTKKLPKLDSFLKTWDLSEQSICVDYNEMYETVDRVLKIPSDVLEKKRNELVVLSYHNFERILSNIK